MLSKWDDIIHNTYFMAIVHQTQSARGRTEIETPHRSRGILIRNPQREGLARCDSTSSFGSFGHVDHNTRAFRPRLNQPVFADTHVSTQGPALKAMGYRCHKHRDHVWHPIILLITGWFHHVVDHAILGTISAREAEINRSIGIMGPGAGGN